MTQGFPTGIITHFWKASSPKSSACGWTVRRNAQIAAYIFDKIKNDGKPFTYTYYDRRLRKRGGQGMAD